MSKTELKSHWTIPLKISYTNTWLASRFFPGSASAFFYADLQHWLQQTHSSHRGLHQEDGVEEDQERLPGDRLWQLGDDHGRPVDLYEVPLRASGRRKITVNCGVRGLHLLYSGLPAICPHNITWTFLQSRGATAYDRHQLSGVTVICIGTDYDVLVRHTL